MELVFYCVDCEKFFYGMADEEHACPHCGSDMTVSTQTPKRWYSVQSNEDKAEFKQRIRTEYTRERVEERRAMLLEQKRHEERKRARAQMSALEKQHYLNTFIMTTGCSFEGYVVTEYIDVMFDEILVGLGFGKSIVSGFDNFFSAVTGTEATTMINKLNEVKDQLKTRLIRKAVDIGANAMLGIDFESSKLGDLIMVSMTGTAVKIKKIDDRNGDNS
jgi:uncharacterized protein YbjQ (UPF0145 family)/DNA-directed RNA polymerase subunit RPC12/RpoP